MHDAHRKLAFSTLAHDTLRTTPLVAGMVTTLRMSVKNSVQELIDYTSYTHTHTCTYVHTYMHMVLHVLVLKDHEV
jgi:hypothetical protein